MKKTFTKLIRETMRLSVIVAGIISMTFGVLKAEKSWSQRLKEQKVSITIERGSLEAALRKIETTGKIGFAYDYDLLKDIKVADHRFVNQSLDQVLSSILSSTGLTFNEKNNTVLIIKAPKPVVESPRAAGFVKGRVVEGSIAGPPIPGVTVKVDGTSMGTSTDLDGKYQLSLTPGKYRLTFMFIGFETRTVDVIIEDGKTRDINIVMTAAISYLQEAVVVGYSSKKIKELTGSIQTLSSKQLEGVTSNNIMSQLKGKAMGLYITEPSGDPTKNSSLVVRGQGTLPITGNSRVTNNLGPLVVVDGVIYSEVLNPSDVVSASDVETVTLLKDAASTAIYGSRAAQGVLLITTKKGSAGETQISVNSTLGMSQRYDGKLDYMNSQELYDYQRKMLLNSFQINPEGMTQEAYLSKYLPAASALGTSTNWENELYRSGITRTINLAASGGNDKTRFYLGGNYYNEDGALKANNLQRTGLRFNIDHNINKKLSVLGNFNMIFDKKNSSPITGNNYILPWFAPNGQKSLGKDALNNNIQNPIYDLPFNNSTTQSQQLMATMGLKYKIAEWIDVSSTNTYSTNQSKYESYQDRLSIAGELAKGSLSLNNNQGYSFMSSNLLNARYSFGKHAVGGLLGGEFNRNYNEFTGFGVKNIPTGVKVPAAASEVANMSNGKPYSGEKFVKVVYSTFTEGNYNYAEKYFGTASFRRDYSTNFGINNRYGNFYSVSGAWLASNEEFLKGNKALTELKVRGSYGTTGKVAGADFLTESFYSFAYQYGGDPAAIINQLGNLDITWEKAYTSNVGLDLGLFKRVNLNVDVYQKRNKGLLQNVATAAVLGVTRQYQNIGQMVNRGVELQLSSKNLVGKFKWTTDFNITFNKNKIEKLTDGTILMGNAGTLKVGDDINAVKAVKWLGVDPQTGNPMFERIEFDANGNEVGRKVVNKYDDVFAGIPAGAQTAAQFQDIGTTTPKYYGGLTNSFNYKGVSLAVLLNFAYGHLVYNNSRGSYFSDEGNDILKNNQVKPAAGQVIWEKPGDIATEPKAYRNRTDGSMQGSSRRWEDASHIRVRNVRLGYDLPTTWLKTMKVANVNVYVSGDNLYVFTKKSFYGLDPEGGLAGESNNYGIGSGYGASRKFLFGLQLTF